MPRRRSIVVLLASLAALGCRGSPPSSALKSVTFAVRADVTGFYPNPPVVDEMFTLAVNANVLEGLARLDREFRLEPALARRWETPDTRTYVFELRPGVLFSDGAPLTAGDVVASLRAALERRWITSIYLHTIESVRAVGERRVEIRTRAPYRLLLHHLTWGFILPARALERDPVPSLGTGPYRLESWDVGKEFVLARNPRFRGPPPDLERVRFSVVPDAEERVARLLRGEASFVDQVPLERVESLRRTEGIRVLVPAGIRVLFLCLRVDAPPFSDARVREAVDLALDRDDLIRRALAGHAEPASQIVPPAIVGYDPTLQVTRPDRARARQLLRAAGHPDGFQVQLDGPRDRYVNDVQILDEVARQLREVGIRVDVRAWPKRDFFPYIERGRSKVHLLGWACQSGEAGDVLDDLHSTAGEYGSNANTTGLADPELDRWIEDANLSPTLAERTIALRRAVARVAELRPAIPLLIQSEAFALSRQLEWQPPLDLALRLGDVRRARGTAVR